ncbi:hypothetical protein ABEF93_005053 [Exophiala dermatitidis]
MSAPRVKSPSFLILSLFLVLGPVSAEICNPEGPKEKGCPIDGNSDYYGLGVRMGIYSSWLTSWFANNFLPEEIIGSLETNSIFLLALFATVFFYSVQENGIRVVDVLVIHQLCIGFLFSVMSLWGYRTMYYRTEGPGGRRHFGGFGTHFRLVLMGMISAYGTWFWVEGVEDGLSACDRRRNCGGLDTFFLVPVKVDSWATRSINLVINIGASVYYGIMALAALAAGTAFVVHRVQGKDVHWELIKEQDSSVNLTKRELTKWYIALSCFNLIWIVFAMISIEFTLNLNHMNNVIGSMGLVGPGQLIPLAIGLMSLTRVLWILARQHIPFLRKKNAEEDTTMLSSPETPKFMGGIGLTMLNTRSTYSPYPYSPEKEKPLSSSTKSPAATTNTAGSPPGSGTGVSSSGGSGGRDWGSISTLPPLPAIATGPKRHSLTHRILLAWLPWLGLFEWSKHSLTPSLGEYSSFSIGGRRGHHYYGLQDHARQVSEDIDDVGGGGGGEGGRGAAGSGGGDNIKVDVIEMTQDIEAAAVSTDTKRSHQPQTQPQSRGGFFGAARFDPINKDNNNSGSVRPPPPPPPPPPPRDQSRPWHRNPSDQEGLLAPEAKTEDEMRSENGMGMASSNQSVVSSNDDYNDDDDEECICHSRGIYDGEGYD